MKESQIPSLVFKKLTYHYYYADIEGLTSGGTNS